MEEWWYLIFQIESMKDLKLFKCNTILLSFW